MKPFSCLSGCIADVVYFFKSSCDEVTVRKIEGVIPKVLGNAIMPKEEITDGVRNWFNLPKQNNPRMITREQFNQQSLLEANVSLALINLQEKMKIKMLIGDSFGKTESVCYSKITKL
jgi:hypothetical protein